LNFIFLFRILNCKIIDCIIVKYIIYNKIFHYLVIVHKTIWIKVGFLMLISVEKKKNKTNFSINFSNCFVMSNLIFFFLTPCIKSFSFWNNFKMSICLSKKCFCFKFWFLQHDEQSKCLTKFPSKKFIFCLTLKYINLNTNAGVIHIVKLTNYAFLIWTDQIFTEITDHFFCFGLIRCSKKYVHKILFLFFFLFKIWEVTLFFLLAVREFCSKRRFVGGENIVEKIELGSEKL